MVVKPIITASEISVEYREFTREKFFSLGKTNAIRAISNISFSITEGEKVAIIGKNGSGKTTLLKCLAGRLRPLSGSIKITGNLIFLSGVDPGFDSELTGRQNIQQLAPVYGVEKSRVDEFIDSIYQFTALGSAFDRKYSGYSAGMKSKLGFGFISELRGDILLIDETFGAGDREFKKKAKAKMNAMVREIPTLVMCSHGLDLVSSICDRGIVIDKGEIAFDGPINDSILFYEELTNDSINWIDIPYQDKDITERGLEIDFTKEFQIFKDMRIVIYDRKLKKFILMDEFDNLDSYSLERDKLPEHLDCMFKIQQFIDDKWYDASRYIRFTKEAQNDENINPNEQNHIGQTH